MSWAMQISGLSPIWESILATLNHWRQIIFLFGRPMPYSPLKPTDLDCVPLSKRQYEEIYQIKCGNDFWKSTSIIWLRWINGIVNVEMFKWETLSWLLTITPLKGHGLEGGLFKQLEWRPVPTGTGAPEQFLPFFDPTARVDPWPTGHSYSSEKCTDQKKHSK